MAEARFIKTVTFGGYDKAEVIRRLEYLYSQMYDLKNELRESKLMLEAYKKGTPEEKAHETILAGEKAKLTQIQVQNETLNTKLKATEDENKNLAQEVKKLRNEIITLKDELKNADAKVAALNSHNEAMALSNVFIEAQKSAAMLEGTARAKASELEDKAKKAAELTIEDANEEAAQIIYEAERTAAETIAEAQNKSDGMAAASSNLRAVMLNDTMMISNQIEQLKGVLESFRVNGLKKLEESDQLLKKTESTLTEGGVPQFRAPEFIEAQIPEKPKRNPDRFKDEQEEEERLKKKSELDKLQQMAEAIGGKKETQDNAGSKQSEDNAPAPKSGKIDLAALAAQANALNKNDK